MGALNLTNNNNYPANTAFRSISVNDTYHLSGNAITLGVGGLILNTATAATLSFPITWAPRSNGPPAGPAQVHRESRETYR